MTLFGDDEWLPRCRVDGCNRPHAGDGSPWCEYHRHGLPEPEPEEREVVFDAAAGKALAEEGQQRAAARRVELRHSFLTAIEKACRAQEYVTADDVWRERGSVPTHHGEASALGPAMRSAVSLGWMKATGGFRASERPEMHQQPVREYQSLLWQGR